MKSINPLAPETILHQRYKIKEIIGRGGTGIVYSAYDITLKIEIAIKELFPNCYIYSSNQKDIYQSSYFPNTLFQKLENNFIQEANFMLDFSKCPNIPVLYDLFKENNTWYYVMELLKGSTLKQYLILNNAPLLEKDVFHIAIKILETLSYIHQYNIIHRDICSDNIFLTESNEIMLIDFGSAIKYTDKNISLITIRKGYTPPEQYQTNGLIGPWTDIYALGAVLYEILTLKKIPESIERPLDDKIISPKQINRQISNNMNLAIIKALSLNPKKRFQTSTEFYEYLKTGNHALYKIIKNILILSLLLLLVIGCVIILSYKIFH